MTESFEDAMAEMRNVITDDCDKTYCAMYDDDCYACESAVLDRLQKAHDHEMEQLRRSRFREGYEAGQRSMDAEHQAVALRLKYLPLDEDSHGNLSQIARAVWHIDFRWTKSACEALRDELVRLLGGVHDEPAPIPASGCACDADCNCGHGDETAVAHDVLGNERHKAVCRLREFVPMIGNKPTEEASKLIRCITGNDDSHVACGNDLEETRDRLIHLLGGDEPLPNPSEPNLPKSAEVAKPESAGGGEITITDELRKWASTEVPYKYGHQLHTIADRIDEQFNRICWQQEAVLQSTIDTMVDERDEMQRERDEWRRGAEHEADKCKEYKGLFERYKGSYVEYVGRYNIAVREREELRKSLRMIAERIGVPHHRSLSMYGDEELKEATLDTIDSKNKHIGALEYQRDRQKKLLDEYDKTHMKLPVDANGESVHVGDIMEYAEGGKPKEVIAVSDTEVFLVDDGPRCSSLCVHHVPVDTAEDIVRDIHLGIVTDSQAVERIRALR